jgi:hypothetical protein
MSNGKTILALSTNDYPIRVLNCKDFNLIEAKDFKKTTDQGIKGYLSMDPRTYDSIRQQYILLDTPPLKVKNTQPLQDIYDNSNNVNTGFHDSYKNIRGGNIIYYTDIDNNLPYTSPVYTIQSYMRPSVLQDPMGQTSTVYQRIPIPNEVKKSSAYSFDQDQMEFREDLISLQSQRMNKNDYEPYHFYRRM